MIIPDSASGKLVLVELIPTTALLGSVSVTVHNNRRFRGIHLLTYTTAVAGAGSHRPQIQNYIGGVGNTIMLPSYSTFVGSLSWVIYPGVGAGPGGSGTTFDEGVLGETFTVLWHNSSAVPGNEVTGYVSVVLLE